MHHKNVSICDIKNECKCKLFNDIVQSTNDTHTHIVPFPNKTNLQANNKIDTVENNEMRFFLLKIQQSNQSL
jgi:hypothetical protein